MLRVILVLPAFALLTLVANARDDADPVKVKLDKAKAAYATELAKFADEIGDYFDKREEAARKAGDKKAVDLVKSERKSFEESGALPATAPRAARQRLATAKLVMERAYAAAVKEYTMGKKDADAARIEKELTAFKQGLDPSDTRRQWVHDTGTFTHLGKGAWDEKAPGGATYKWKEVRRTKDYVELHAVIADVAYTIRLTDKSADYQSGKSDFKPKYTGKWAD